MPLKLYEKKQILDSCFKVFVEYGYANTTTLMLAEAAGISKALLFHHFKSKKKLYISILEVCFEKMAAEIEDEPISELVDFFEAKGQSSLNKIKYLRKNPDIGKLLFEAYVNTPNDLKEELYEFVMKLKVKYGSIDDEKNRKMKALFDEIPLRDDIDNNEAYEFVNVVMDYFRQKISKELTDENKLNDDQYWEDLFRKKKKFLEMIRFGIEEKGR